MYLSSKMRVVNQVLRKQKIMVNTRVNINTLVSWVHSLMLYIGYKYISLGPFGQTFCGMGRIPNGFIPFSSMENVFPNSLINS